MGGVSNADGKTALPLEVDSGTGALLVTGGGGGQQYAELNTTAPGTGTLALGRYKASAPTLTDGQLYGLQLDSSGNLKVTGSLSVGGTTDNSAFTAGSGTGTPAMGFYHSVIDTVTDGRAATIGITNKRAMFVNLQNSSGTEIGTSSNPVQVTLANTGANTNKLLVTPDSVALPANQSVNISQINAVTPLMGNGTTGTGSLRVTIASDNTAFSVNSTLSAETTKVIGTVRNADGAGNLLTTNSSTYTAKFALDGNLLGTLGTAFSTAGKVDVKGADGDVFVRQATAANLNATVVQGTGSNLHTVVDSGTITTVSTVTSLTQFNGNAISTNTGATGAGVLRTVTANDAGKTLTSKGGSVSSSGDNTLVAAGTNRLKVYAFSLTTTSTSAVTCIFQSGASGTELWRVTMQAVTGASTGANLVVTPPAWLFATASATLLNLNLSAAVAVHWSVAYYDEA